MTEKEFVQLLGRVQATKVADRTLAIMAPHWDGAQIRAALSSFSNQDEGGVLLFGFDEARGCALVGVRDAAGLLRNLRQLCAQMDPAVQADIAVHAVQGKTLVAVDVPSLPLERRPCYHKGLGPCGGAFVRRGTVDRLMSPAELYALEAFRKGTRDDVRPVKGAERGFLDVHALRAFLARAQAAMPDLAKLCEEEVCEQLGLSVQGRPTLAAWLLFGLCPQASLPGLCIKAIAVPGVEVGDIRPGEPRFLDSLCIEGTLPHMLAQTLGFVHRNRRTQICIDQDTGRHRDRRDSFLAAVQELVLNALMHRDYSRFAEAIPICLTIFSDRLELDNPGCFYGRARADASGFVQAETRNPALAQALQILGLARNQGQGLSHVREILAEEGLPFPELRSDGSFRVILRREHRQGSASSFS